jgi:predicted nucleic acid-binding protein
LKAVLDTNILIDLLKGREEANTEVGRYAGLAISRISWIEVLIGATSAEDQDRIESLLNFFEVIELDEVIARAAIWLRRQHHRLRLPDAVIWATARVRNYLFVARDARDFPVDDPGIRVPY